MGGRQIYAREPIGGPGQQTRIYCFTMLIVTSDPLFYILRKRNSLYGRQFVLNNSKSIFLITCSDCGA